MLPSVSTSGDISQLRGKKISLMTSAPVTVCILHRYCFRGLKSIKKRTDSWWQQLHGGQLDRGCGTICQQNFDSGTQVLSSFKRLLKTFSFDWDALPLCCLIAPAAASILTYSLTFRFPGVISRTIAKIRCRPKRALQSLFKFSLKLSDVHCPVFI